MEPKLIKMEKEKKKRNNLNNNFKTCAKPVFCWGKESI